MTWFGEARGLTSPMYRNALGSTHRTDKCVWRFHIGDDHCFDSQYLTIWGAYWHCYRYYRGRMPPVHRVEKATGEQE